MKDIMNDLNPNPVTQRNCACASGGPDPVKGKAGARGLASRLGLLALGLAAWIVVYAYLEPAALWLTTGLLGLDTGTHLGEAVRFFVFDTPKVFLLLVLIVYGVGVVRSFFTPEATRKALAGKAEFVGNVMAAGLGVLTPFCSCSAVPLFVGFVTAGVPLGVTFSFLISAPMVNEVALALLFGMFGWKVALLYAGTGLFVAIVAGFVIGRLKLEGWLQGWVRNMLAMGSGAGPQRSPTWNDRLDAGQEAVREIVGKVWLYVILGIGVGALIHGYVPENFMAGLMGRSAWWSVPAAVLIGIPMYTNAAGVVPVLQALIGKGAALGTALAFMMSVIALSLPEMLILRKVLTGRLIAVFVGVVGAGILLVGWLFNAVI
ncbi:MAG: permease [Desulfovibrio sp.]